jgi:hypothetical protein
MPGWTCAAWRICKFPYRRRPEPPDRRRRDGPGPVGTQSGADTQTYLSLPNKVGGAASGIEYAYRDVGQSTVPLVLLQHFRGNLNNWDPALIDALASTRRVVTFDNAGVGCSTGTTPDTIEQMASDAIVSTRHSRHEPPPTTNQPERRRLANLPAPGGEPGGLGGPCWPLAHRPG